MKTSIPHYYHCATKGFDHSVLFADTREFIAGMNRIGICLATLQETAKIIVIAFCLMDNHIHFILYGTREDCNKWMSLYHRLTMIWQKKHRDSDSVDELWEYDAWQIMDQEDLKEKIAYVFRNPTDGVPPHLYFRITQPRLKAGEKSAKCPPMRAGICFQPGPPSPKIGLFNPMV